MKLPLFATGFLLSACLCLSNCADKKPHRPDGPGSGGIGMGNPQQNAQQMADELGLNADQKKKFMAAMKDHGEKMRSLHNKSSLSQEDRSKQANAARQQLAKKMHGILTSEQFQKWQQERQAMHQNGQGGLGGPGGPPGPGPGNGAAPPVGPMGGYPSNGVPPGNYRSDPNYKPDATGNLPPKGVQLGGNEPAPALPPLPPVNSN